MLYEEPRPWAPHHWSLRPRHMSGGSGCERLGVAGPPPRLGHCAEVTPCAILLGTWEGRDDPAEYLGAVPLLSAHSHCELRRH